MRQLSQEFNKKIYYEKFLQSVVIYRFIKTYNFTLFYAELVRRLWVL